MFCRSDRLEKCWGYSKLGDDLLGVGLDIYNFADGSGASHLIAFTSTHVYRYLSASDKWQIMNQQLQVASCDSGWGGSYTGGNGTWVVSHDSANEKEGTACLSVVVTSALADKKLAFSGDLSPTLNLTKSRDAIIFEEDFDTIGFWIKSSVALAANSLALVVTSAASGAKSGTYDTITISTALVADTWTYLEYDVDLSTSTAVLSVGLWNVTELGAMTILLDDVRALKLYSGDTDTKWSFDVVHDTTVTADWQAFTALVASNGIDKPIFWDGDIAGRECFEEFYVPTTEFVDFAFTRLLFELDNQLFFADFNDGQQRGLNIKWADFAHCYGVGGFVDGVYGEAVVPNTKGSLIRAVRMDDKYVLYCKNSLGVLYATETTLLFDFINLLPIGLLGYHCVWEGPDGHAIIGSDRKFYL